MLALTLAVLSCKSAAGADAKTEWLTVWRGQTATRAPGAGSTYEIGINANRLSERGPSAAASLGTSLVRIEWEIGTPATDLDYVVAEYALAGVRVQPLASFLGRLPTTAEAQNVRSWAVRFGPDGTFWEGRDNRLAINLIEFGNETSYRHQYGDNFHDASYASRAREYALRAREAADALEDTGVGLLVQADDGGSTTSRWVDEMFASVPDLGTYAAGWVVHPYGPTSSARIGRIVSSVGAHGVPLSRLRIFITEWGLASDNGNALSDNYGYPVNMSYDDAGRTLAESISSWRRAYGDILAEVMIYTDFDHRRSGISTDREAYFGLFKDDGSDKGAYTAAARSEIREARRGANAALTVMSGSTVPAAPFTHR